MVETIAAVHSSKMLVDAKPIEHGTTEVDGFIGQDGQLTVGKPVQSFPNPRIKSRAVQHVGAVVGKKHLQARLNVRLRGLWTEGPADQHQGAIADKTSNFIFRQNREIKLMANVVYRRSKILFGVDQRAIKIEDEN